MPPQNGPSNGREIVALRVCSLIARPLDVGRPNRDLQRACSELTAAREFLRENGVPGEGFRARSPLELSREMSINVAGDARLGAELGVMRRVVG